MALKKTFHLLTGVPVSVYRIQGYRIDYNSREASATFSAYLEEASTVPVVPVFAKLRLEGVKFDMHLSKASLMGSAFDVNAILYQAMHTEPVVSDAGKDFFKDAEDI